MKMSMPTQDFTKALKACRVACNGREVQSRPHLAGVWFRALPGGGVHAWATNGHWLAVVRLPQAQIETPGVAQISASDISRVLATAPKGNNGGPTTLTLTGRVLRIDFGTALTAVEVRMTEMQPVPIQDVVPKGKSTKKHERRAINIDLIRDALDGIDAMSTTKRGKAAKFYPMGPTANDPVIIWSPQARDYFALLMPMRDDSKRDMAWWNAHAEELVAMKVAADAAKAPAEPAHAAAQ